MVESGGNMRYDLSVVKRRVTLDAEDVSRAIDELRPYRFSQVQSMGAKVWVLRPAE